MVTHSVKQALELELFKTGAVETAASADGGGGEFEARGVISIATALAIFAGDHPIRKIMDLGAARGWLMAVVGTVSEAEIDR